MSLTPPTPSRERRTAAGPADPLWFRCWLVALPAFFLACGVALAWQQAGTRRREIEDVRAYLDPDTPDPGRTAADRVSTDSAEQVEIGVYILQVRELSIHDSRWQVIFDIWFEWRGERKSPFENLVLINGSLDSSHLHEQIEDGDLHYERYEIAATLTKEFHVAHFPLDEHLLVLAFENARSKRQDLLFVPDASGSEVSSQVSIPGYRIRGMECVESPRSYKTARGRPGVSPSVRDTFSQARFAVRIVRDGWGLYWKMFQALFVAVAISLLPLFVRPTNLDPRFGLGVGALFAAVANVYVVGSFVPNTDYFALADIVNLLGIITILITLIESVVSLWVCETSDDPGLAQRLDHYSFWCIVIGYVVANALLIAGATIRG